MVMRFVAKVMLGCASLALVQAASARDIAIQAGRLVDGTRGPVQSQVTILVKDDRIVGVANGYQASDGAEVIDLRNATVLPGLIDTHVHLASQVEGGSPLLLRLTTTNYDRAIKATVYAARTLDAGFTTVRDLNAPTQVIIALKRSIDTGVVPGPRIWASGQALGPTGGHSDPRNGLDPGLDKQDWSDAVIDGPEQAVVAVRRLRREGVQLIKIMPSGGVLSIGDDPNHTTMSDAEIKAVVDTAHALGMKVAAHAHGEDAINRAVVLGVDSIEHGTYASDRSFALMKKHGTWLVPTLLVADTAMRMAREHPEAFNPSSAAKALEVAPHTIANLGNAYRAGVKIAFGTDMVLAPHGTNAKEFALMVKTGMTPRDAILAATSDAAELIGDPQDIGSVQVGRYADIIAVDGDPLTDVTVLEHVRFVMKGGKVVRDAATTGERHP